MNKLDNFREQIENVIALALMAALVAYIVFTFWYEKSIPALQLGTFTLIPETYPIPLIMLWAVFQRAASNVNPSGWMQGFWRFLDRWGGLAMTVFALVTLVYAIAWKSNESYVALLVGVLIYAAYDWYDNWTRGLHAAHTSGLPMIDELPKEVTRPVDVIVEPHYYLRHPFSGEKRPWNPRPLIEAKAAEPPAAHGGSSE